MDYSPTDENLQFGIKHMSGSFAFSPLHLYQMEEVTSITVTTRFHSLVLGYTIQNTVSESRTRRSENHLQKAELDAKHKTDKMCSGEFQNCYEPVTAMS